MIYLELRKCIVGCVAVIGYRRGVERIEEGVVFRVLDVDWNCDGGHDNKLAKNLRFISFLF